LSHSHRKIRRRSLLAGTAAALAFPVLGQPRGAGAPTTVVQIIDTSVAAQDVAKDFLIGSRAAWQDINAHGGLRGTAVQHVTLEVDGADSSVAAALKTALATPDCLVLSGTVSDPAAELVTRQLAAESGAIAHAAPWLQNSAVAVGDATFPIFAGRREQVAHALRSLALVGVQEAGVIYASAREQSLYRDDIGRAAAELKLRLASYAGRGDLEPLGRQLGPQSPALLLFVGGTPELVQFTQGLDHQSRQRFVVALADVNLQTLSQMGAGRATPVIATQPVPMVTAALPIVRAYRDVLGRLFDEPPVALSLAGFIAARYTFEVLQQVKGPLTRASVLAAFRRRQPVDLGGYPIAFDAQRRSAGYVTQGMLTTDGRLVA
jgi:ABC-type branched-subunit amino acid transport system substrate-binding protein